MRQKFWRENSNLPILRYFSFGAKIKFKIFQKFKYFHQNRKNEMKIFGVKIQFFVVVDFLVEIVRGDFNALDSHKTI